MNQPIYDSTYSPSNLIATNVPLYSNQSFVPLDSNNYITSTFSDRVLEEMLQTKFKATIQQVEDSLRQTHPELLI